MSMPLRWEYVATEAPTHARVGHARLSTRHFWKLAAAIAVLAVVVPLAMVGAGSLWPLHAAGQPLVLLPTAAGPAPATLASASIERRLGFVTVTGSVRSASTHPLHDVEAIVELLNADAHPVQVEAALIPVSTLAPGQTVPFQIETNDKSAAVAYRVTFTEMNHSPAN